MQLWVLWLWVRLRRKPFVSGMVGQSNTSMLLSPKDRCVYMCDFPLKTAVCVRVFPPQLTTYTTSFLFCFSELTILACPPGLLGGDVPAEFLHPSAGLPSLPGGQLPILHRRLGLSRLRWLDEHHLHWGDCKLLLHQLRYRKPRPWGHVQPGAEPDCLLPLSIHQPA